MFVCVQEEQRLRAKKAKEDLEEFLMNNSKMNSSVKYRCVCMCVCVSVWVCVCCMWVYVCVCVGLCECLDITFHSITADLFSHILNIGKLFV